MMRLRLDRAPGLPEQNTERVVRLGILGIDRQGLPQSRLGAIHRAASYQTERQASQQPWSVGGVANRLGQYCLRLARTVQVEEHVTKIAERRHQRWIELQGATIGCLGLGQPPSGTQHHTEIRTDSRV